MISMLLGFLWSEGQLSFGAPWYLMGLAGPIALLYWTWSGGGRRLVLPLDHARATRGRGLWALLKAAESLPSLVLAVAVLLLAVPQTLDAPKEKRALTNIEFCLDVSGSMTAQFGQGTRYDAAMESINDFLEYRDGDAFGLTFFGNTVLHWVPLTSDVSAFRCAAPFMDPKRSDRPQWFGGTEIGRALRSCRDVLVGREEGDRMIILVSDGQSSDLGGGNDLAIAEELRKDGIVIYGIHIGDGAIPDETVNVAVASGGDIFAADDPQALDNIFEQIDEMAKAKIEKVAAQPIDNFEPFVLVGLSLLGLHLLLQFLFRFTPW